MILNEFRIHAQIYITRAVFFYVEKLNTKLLETQSPTTLHHMFVTLIGKYAFLPCEKFPMKKKAFHKKNVKLHSSSKNGFSKL